MFSWRRPWTTLSKRVWNLKQKYADTNYLLLLVLPVHHQFCENFEQEKEKANDWNTLVESDYPFVCFIITFYSKHKFVEMNTTSNYFQWFLQSQKLVMKFKNYITVRPSQLVSRYDHKQQNLFRSWTLCITAINSYAKLSCSYISVFLYNDNRSARGGVNCNIFYVSTQVSRMKQQCVWT